MGPTSGWRRHEWIVAIRILKDVEWAFFRKLNALPGPRSAQVRRALYVQNLETQEITAAYYAFLRGRGALFQRAFGRYRVYGERATRLFKALGAPHC
jgi:hypothetical protein